MIVGEAWGWFGHCPYVEITRPSVEIEVKPQVRRSKQRSEALVGLPQWQSATYESVSTKRNGRGDDDLIVPGGPHPPFIWHEIDVAKSPSPPLPFFSPSQFPKQMKSFF